MSNQKKAVTTKLTKDQQATYDACTSIASKVRFMLTITPDRGEVSRFMTAAEGREIRYQWVRNVALTPLKKAA
jgi:hypothetical protein